MIMEMVSYHIPGILYSDVQHKSRNFCQCTGGVQKARLHMHLC